MALSFDAQTRILCRAIGGGPPPPLETEEEAVFRRICEREAANARKMGVMLDPINGWGDSADE